MEGICALCRQKKELQLSHIVPKFVIRHLKKTSIGSIRGQNPNKIVQDGEKHYMLCHKCEEVFSASEKRFADKVFYPYLKNHETKFDVDEKIYYFLTSLSWRSLYLDITGFVKEGTLKRDVLECMIQSEGIMRDFLLGKRADLDKIEHHIFFFDRVQSSTAPDSENINVVVHRTEQSYSAFADGTIFTISNLMGILVVTLYQKDNRESWLGTRVYNKPGKLYTSNQQVTSLAMDEINFWCKKAKEMRSKLGASEYRKIVKRLKDAADDIQNYPIYQDVIDDFNLQTDTEV
jgi:hypothetical protein